MHRLLAATLLGCLAGGLLAQGSAPPIRQEAQEAFRQAMALNKAKDYARALEYFMKAYQADQAVLSLDDQGLLDSAMSHLKEQLVASPNDVNHCFQLAEVLKLKGQNDEALQYYRKVVDLDRNTPLATLAEGEIRAIEAQGSGGSTASGASATSTATGAAVPPPVSAPPAPPATPQADPRVVQELREAVETLQQRVQELEAELTAEKERASTESDEMEKLKKEHEELKAKAETWKLYYHLYFSKPQNIQDLKNPRTY